MGKQVMFIFDRFLGFGPQIRVATLTITIFSNNLGGPSTSWRLCWGHWLIYILFNYTCVILLKYVLIKVGLIQKIFCGIFQMFEI
jgi:hypothetical protein